MGKEARSVINFNKNWKRKTFSCGTTHSIYQGSFSPRRARHTGSQTGKSMPFHKEPGEVNTCHMALMALFWFKVSVREIGMQFNCACGPGKNRMR